MTKIKEVNFENSADAYHILGYPKSVHLHMTKAIRSTEILTFVYEEKDTPVEHIIRPYGSGHETKGFYLGSIRRKNNTLLHFYHEKVSV